MEKVTVLILGTAITARHGTLTAGTTLTTDAEFAAHLVDDCAVARYTESEPAPASSDAKTEKPTKPARRGKAQD